MNRYLLYGAVIALFVAFMAAPHHWLIRAPTLSLAQTLTRQLAQGHLIGSHQGDAVSADFNLAEPGDIILCHNPGGAYGYWTHAVLYVGRGQVVDANDFVRGTELRGVNHYRQYTELMLVRAKESRDVRQAAVTTALRAVGTPYDPLATLRDTRTEYCSKLIWQSYAQAGIELCPPSDWVLPDNIATSQKLACVGYWCAINDGGDSPRVVR